jgi:hypothetical protein
MCGNALGTQHHVYFALILCFDPLICTHSSCAQKPLRLLPVYQLFCVHLTLIWCPSISSLFHFLASPSVNISDLALFTCVAK